MNETQIRQELLLFPEWTELKIDEAIKETALKDIFNLHCEKYAEFIEAGELINNPTLNFLMDTPDGYLPIGDFWVKSARNIHEVKFENVTIKVSEDHLLETESGFIHTKDLREGDLVITKDGLLSILSNIVISNEEVYDWEVLHENHRYWCDGVSSHNTGKTFLLLNMCREAQKKGYYVIYYDTEGAVDFTNIQNFGVDPSKFDHQPVSDIAKFRTSITTLIKKMMEAKEKGFTIPKIFIALDSLGMLATTKEIDDAISGNTAADMTRAKMVRSLFRIITSDLTGLGIPFVFTNHTYACFPGTQTVLTDIGEKSIKDLKVGDKVQTLIGYQPIEDIFEYENSDMVEIELENGQSIKCTPNHEFLIDEKWEKSESWIRADKLKGGDFILSTYLKDMNKIQVKSVKKISNDKVYDVQVKDAHHYVLGNGIVAHNSTGMFPTINISGGGGLVYSASVILALSKAQIKDDKIQTGIIVTVKTLKNRFGKPIPIKFHIRWDKGMNPYIGMEEYMSWDNCGIEKGNLVGQKEYDKWSAADKAKTKSFEFNGETLYFYPKDTARNYIVKHLGCGVPATELFTEKVWTREVLEIINEKCIKPKFSYGIEENAIEIEEYFIENGGNETTNLLTDVE